MNLLESYKNRLVVSESVYSKQHSGEKMDQHRKLVVANCLKNVSSFLNEAFNSSTGATQQADLGLWKKFC